MKYIRKSNRGEVFIGTGTLPNISRPCLFVGNEYGRQRVAIFNDEKSAKLFESYMNAFTSYIGELQAKAKEKP